MEELWRPGMDVVHGDTQATPLELERTTIPKSDAWVLAEEQGEGLVMAFHSFIFIHSFRKYHRFALPSRATRQTGVFP